MADTFNVEVNDKIDPTIATKLDQIAKNAGASNAAVEKLKAQINAVSSGPVGSLEAAVKAATNNIDKEAKAVNKLTSELKNLEKASKATGDATTKAFRGFDRNQSLNLGYQIQDIIVSLQGGQKPLTVFLQQGGQIGQVFAQSGATASQGLAGIGRILLSFINPMTVLLASVVAVGAAIYNFKSYGAEINSFAGRLGVSTQEAQKLYQALYKITGLNLDEQKKELTSVGLTLNKAGRENDKDSQLTRLFTDNGLSIVDATGKLKSFSDQMDMVYRLVKNAKTEFDAIEIGRLVGASDDFAISLFKSKTTLTQAKTEAQLLEDKLIEGGANFDKKFDEVWRNIVLYAKNAILQIGKFFSDMLDAIPKDPIGTLVTKTINAAKGAPQAVADVIRNDGPGPGPISVNRGLGRNTPLGDNRSKLESSFPNNPAPPRSDSIVPFTSFNDRFDLAGTKVGSLNAGDNKVSQDNLQRMKEIYKSATAAKEAVKQAETVLPTKKPTVIPKASVDKEPKAAKPKFDVEEDINIKLDQQIARLKLLKPEREIQQQMDEIDNKLRRQGKTLNDEERVAIENKVKEIERLKDVQQATDQIYEETIGVQKRYAATLEAAENLLKKGIITQDQYGDAVMRTRIKMLDSQNTISGGLESGLLRTVQEYGNVSQQVSRVVGNSFDGLADGLTAFATNQKFSFGDLTTSILNDVTKMVIKIGVLKPLLDSIGGALGGSGTGASGGLGGLLSSAIGALSGSPVGNVDMSAGVAGPNMPRFANGGGLQVKGDGGTDSETVQFKASPGERVKVLTPAQAANDAKGANVKVEVNNYGNDNATVEKSRGADGGDVYKVMIRQIKSDIASDISSGNGPVGKATQTRFGLDPARGAR